MDDILPVLLCYSLVDARVPDNLNTVLEQRHKKQDAGAVARLEHLFFEKRRLCPPMHTLRHSARPGHPPTQRGNRANE